jgi:exonuclease SbcC
MRPEKLRLRNFGPFTGEETIDFTALDDLFLITGKTGSGKTTIFDALCYALYGSVPGSRRGHIPRLRSDYAGEEEECSVSLEFSAGEKRYRLDRSPRREKRKKRGTGFTSLEESAALYELAGGELLPLSARKSEADQKVRELIGLEAEEFFKIVLLPQGEFAEFLKQNSTDRRAVLGKLFPVDRAARLRELAQEKAREAAFAVREAERVLGELSLRVSFETYGEAHARGAEALEAAKARLSALGEEEARLRAARGLRENEGETAERLGETAAARSRLEAEAPEIAAKEAALSRSRKAQPLRHYLLGEKEKREAAEQGAAEYREAAAALAAAEAADREAQAGAAEFPALEEAAGKLRERRPPLLALGEEEEKLRRDDEEIALLKERLEALAARGEAAGEELRKKEGAIGEAEKLSLRGAELDRRWEACRDLMDRLVQLKKIAGEGEALRLEEGAAAKRLGEIGASRGELEERVPVLGAELEQRRREKEAQERADMAAHLGAALRPGEPCPVCGSREHPLPAAAPAPVFGIDQRISSLEQARRDAERDLAARIAEGEALTEQLARTGGKIAALEQAAAEIRAGAPPAEDDPALGAFLAAPGLPEAAAAGRFLEARIRLLNDLTARRGEARRAGNRLGELYRERNELLALRAEGEKEAAGLREKYRLLREAAEEARRRRRGLLAEWGLDSAGEALAELDRRAAALERRIREGRENRERAGRELAAARAREESAAQKRDTAAAQAREAAAALEAALEGSPFAGAEELAAALLEGEGSSRLEEDISRWRDEGARLRTLGEELERRLRSLRAEAAGLGDLPETAAIAPRLAALEAEREEAEARRDQAAQALASLERDEALLREAAGRYESLSRRSFELNALADDLAGRNPKKKSFDAWLLARYLAEVAAYASKRLFRMSESRYSLLLDGGATGGRARTGLDLGVFDSYTGKQRPCATLSGGESFMASISLALGLADSIQARSGGVRLDAVFIDEGFGSLDEGSLDKALIILDELRDHRMVGLISHVGEMRSRIPSRIEVVKSTSGSKIVIEG